MSLVAWAAPAGIGAGLAAWLLAGGLSANLAKMEGVEAQLASIKAPVARGRQSDVATAELLAAPLFALTTGPGAVREPSMRLDGISISLSHRRTAALVSIDGKTSLWMSIGETQDGVTLQAVTGSTATFETAVGAKTLNLGEQSAASAPSPTAAQPPGPDQAPAGIRKPPEPASAPGLHK